MFSGTPKTEFNYMEAFSFLTESRKKQLIKLLDEAGCLPVYYPGDAEVYLKAARCADGSLMVAFFNLGLDPLEEIELTSRAPFETVERLSEDGAREAVAFDEENGRAVIRTPGYTLNPVILFLK